MELLMYFSYGTCPLHYKQHLWIIKINLQYSFSIFLTKAVFIINKNKTLLYIQRCEKLISFVFVCISYKIVLDQQFQKLCHNLTQFSLSVCLHVCACCCSVSLHALHVLRSICKPFPSLSPKPGLISASFMTELYLNATEFSIPLPGLRCSRCQAQTHHICYTKAITATRGGGEIQTHKQKLKECPVLTNAQSPTHTSHLCVHTKHHFI